MSNMQTTKKMKMTWVVFIKDTYLPRFVMKKGDKWHVRTERLTENGFTLGGGFVESERYRLISE